jgi:hypothetical protein
MLLPEPFDRGPATARSPRRLTPRTPTCVSHSTGRVTYWSRDVGRVALLPLVWIRSFDLLSNVERSPAAAQERIGSR